MTMSFRCQALCCLFWVPALILLGAASAVSETYDWGSLPVGGGGYVTGIVIHPTAADRIYIRTDVGGAYRWDAPTASWIQLLGWLGPSDANLVGVDGIAIDAQLPNRVYAALGKSIASPGGVYRSDDCGVTWTNLLSANFDGNSPNLRWAGECLAVDPLTSSVIYCGTRLTGLWRSTDTGATWAQVAAVPLGFTGTNPTGVRSVVFDPSNATSGRSSLIYVGVPGSGIYASSDGGTTFSALAGAPTSPMRMQVVAGHLFVTHASGVAMWSGGTWHDLTPASGAGMNYCALAVDPANALNVVVAQRYSSYFNPIYRSRDGGTTWAQLNTGAAPATLHVAVPWWQQNRFSSATAAMAFDPLTPGQLYYTDWFGIWRTPNVWATPMDWYTVEQGHEETVVLTLVAPTSGALVYSGMADNFGFRHQSLTGYPSQKLDAMAEGFSIAVCEQNPTHLAVLGASAWSGTNLTLATSADSGGTWTTRTLPAGVQLGRIACSSTDPTRLVYIAGGGAVSYSSDDGMTWNATSGAPSGAVGLSDIWNKDFAIAADSVDGSRFYLFKSGQLFASSDGGVTWAAQNAAAIPSQSGFLNVVARPGTTQEVWVSLDGNGLYRTTTGGSSFTKISAFSTATLFCFGAPPSGSTIPAAYCYGANAGVIGLFRSLDLGASWVQVNDAAHQFPSGAKTLAADRTVFGRVYIGSGGCGIFTGQPQAVATTSPPEITTQPSGQSVPVGATATFTVVASGTPTPTYQWIENGTAIANAIGANYTTPAAVLGDTGEQFTCVVTNSAGTMTSNAATLTVTAPVGGTTSGTTTSATTGTGTGTGTTTTGTTTNGTASATSAGSGSSATSGPTTGSSTGTTTGSATTAGSPGTTADGPGFSGRCGLGSTAVLLIGAVLMLRRRR